MIEQIFEVGMSMFIYIIGVAGVLYVLATAVLASFLYLPVPLKEKNGKIYYRDELISESRFALFSVVVAGKWILGFVLGGLVIVVLGIIGIILGVPVLA